MTFWVPGFLHSNPLTLRAAIKEMPRLRKLASEGYSATLDPVLPAVTCSVQASLLTGKTPTDHGIVGNGWYFRDLGEVFLWRQHNKLVQGEKVWETARRTKPGFRAAKVTASRPAC